MLPITKLLGDSGAASGAILRSVAGIHLDQLGTSLCSFVPQKRDERRPRSVLDIFGKTAACEPLYLECFDRDHAVITYQARACLMKVVSATANRCRVASTYFHTSLQSALGPP